MGNGRRKAAGTGVRQTTRRQGDVYLIEARQGLDFGGIENSVSLPYGYGDGRNYGRFGGDGRGEGFITGLILRK
jgi:hypothetical protein